MSCTGPVPTSPWRRLRWSGTLVAGACLLAACTTPNRAPVVDMSPTQPAAPTVQAPATGASSYVVRPGDTLYSISRSQNVGWQDLARWNNITDPSQLRVGQSLRIEGGTPPTAMAEAPSGVVQVQPIGGSNVQQRPVVGGPVIGGTPGTPPDAPAGTPGAAPGAPGPVPTPPPSAPRQSNDSGIDWLWPASGQVIAQFNQAQNKGVDIEGQVGDPVVASADGTVVYSGSGLRGYGNLIIIRHNASFLSAYAHNSNLLAKEGQTVRRGERIAEMGQTDAPSPRLHFEIRRGGTPEDPMRFLPPR